MSPSEYARNLATKDAEIADLRDEVARLTALIQPEEWDRFPRSWMLTPSEAKILHQLMTHDLVTWNTALNALYFDKPDDEPDRKIIVVYVSKLRGKIGRHGFVAENVHARGYRMPAEAKTALTLAINPQRAAA